ncbi:hypothetical protein ACFP3I_06655 [Chryseobacterium arachidis]|uniref:hypothetical protein n=1 Tax=Chryseobacterium arachidis TaxID=1416778 RepID=UPI003621FD83
MFFFNCKEKQDIIDNSFQKKYKVNEPSLVISSNIKEDESYISGEFKYFSNNFSIKNQIFMKDSIYYYETCLNFFYRKSMQKISNFGLQLKITKIWNS